MQGKVGKGGWMVYQDDGSRLPMFRFKAEYGEDGMGVMKIQYRGPIENIERYINEIERIATGEVDYVRTPIR